MEDKAESCDSLFSTIANNLAQQERYVRPSNAGIRLE